MRFKNIRSQIAQRMEIYAIDLEKMGKLEYYGRHDIGFICDKDQRSLGIPTFMVAMHHDVFPIAAMLHS